MKRRSKRRSPLRFVMRLIVLCAVAGIAIAASSGLTGMAGGMGTECQQSTGVIESYKRLAQTFVPTASGPINSASVYIKRNHDPGTLTIQIRNTSGTDYKPGSTVYASIETERGFGSTSWQEYEFTFPSPATVTAGTHYALVLIEEVGYGDSDDQYHWGERLSDPYASGKGWSSNQSDENWSERGDGLADFCFDIEDCEGGDTCADNWAEIKEHDCFAQTFVPATSGMLTQVDVFLKKVNSPGTLTIQIRNTTGTDYKPGSTIYASMETARGYGSTTWQYHQFTFPSPATVTAGTRYALVLIEEEGYGGSNDEYLWGELLNNPYANGNSWNGTCCEECWSRRDSGQSDFCFDIHIEDGGGGDTCADNWAAIQSWNRCAQIFAAPISGPLTNVDVFLKKVNNPGTLTIQIRNTVGTNYSPGSTVYASIETERGYGSSSWQYHQFTFPSPTWVVAGMHYALVLIEETSYGGSNDQYFWGELLTNPYNDGESWCSSSSGTEYWTERNSGQSDFCFDIEIDCGSCTGEPGPQGPQGPEGPQGPPGECGQCDPEDCQCPAGPEGPQGLNCWDLNGNGVGDSAEDINDDGVFDALDCQGPEGPQGPEGDCTDCPPGSGGLNCWDLNGNGVGDSVEDINDDGVFDALDCQGPEGPEGPQGPAGPQGPEGPQGPAGECNCDGGDGDDTCNCGDCNCECDCDGNGDGGGCSTCDSSTCTELIKKITELANRVTSLEVEQAKLEKELNKTRADLLIRIQEIEAQIKSIKDDYQRQIEQLKCRIAAIESQLAKDKSQLEAQINQVQQNAEQKISALQAEILRVERRAADDIATLSRKIELLQQEQQRQVASLEQEIATLQRNIDRRVLSLETELQSIKLEMSQALYRMSTLESQVPALKEQVANLQQKVSQLEMRLAALEADVCG